jgi:prolyl oligopeptidase
MTARLQQATSSGLPVLLRTDPDAGHGSGKPLKARIEELTDAQAFVMDQLGVAASH